MHLSSPVALPVYRSPERTCVCVCVRACVRLGVCLGVCLGVWLNGCRPLDADDDLSFVIRDINYFVSHNGIIDDSTLTKLRRPSPDSPSAH